MIVYLMIMLYDAIRGKLTIFFYRHSLSLTICNLIRQPLHVILISGMMKVLLSFILSLKHEEEQLLMLSKYVKPQGIASIFVT